MNKAPYTWCGECDTGNRRVVDLSRYDVPSVPVLGENRARTMSNGARFHRHEAFELTVCERGSVKFDLGGRAWALLPGNVFVTRPGEIHRLRSNVRGSVLNWMFVMPPARGVGLLGLPLKDSQVLLKRLAALDRRLYRLPVEAQRILPTMIDLTRRPESDINTLALRICAARFLLAVVEASPAAAVRGKQELMTMLARMRREPEAEYPLSLLVREVKMGETALVAAFKRETGQPPHEFLITCRIRKAMTELRNHPERTITDLALMLGFASSQHFAARFRRETGLTPGEWRKKGVNR